MRTKLKTRFFYKAENWVFKDVLSFPITHKVHFSNISVSKRAYFVNNGLKIFRNNEIAKTLSDMMSLSIGNSYKICFITKDSNIKPSIFISVLV